MSQMELTKQEDEWGCAAACVASLLDIPYGEALERLLHHKNGSLEDDPKGLDVHEIIWTLSDYDLWYIADWRRPSKFPVGSIVCIRGTGAYKDDHYLLRTEKGWMDPWHNIPKKDFNALWRSALPMGTQILFTLMPKHAKTS
ncbi:hypothetical protein [Stenotrophomonas maltophilia]|uniref:hypothetical protein n=1 Tax=Stenotrophomonas maltophilia TaxID=40324 RepID=UPI002894655E|nr:hypothetical protein [Stenotrophomonas maltophilia]MDT3488359.1 hypothetical protein [Stenotrophomonas maltophilia]